MSRPLIGISGRRLAAGVIAGMDERFAARHIDMFYGDYARCVAAAGGLPVELPFEAAAAEPFEHLQALVITGGQDVHPDNWGGDPSVVDPDLDPRQHYGVHDRDRDDAELSLVRQAVDAGVPVLGVCRGIQLINTAFGGTLVPDLPTSDVGHSLPHQAPHDGLPDHLVRFEPGTLAHEVFGAERRVNSWHHQAVDRCGAQLLVSGRAPDGVVESVELPGRSLLGVQWHPEWHNGADPAFDWLVRAAAGVRA